MADEHDKKAPKKDDAFLASLVARPLSPFEGRDVRRAGIEIPGAGGGLREALAFEPVELRRGERVYVLLECEVDKIRFDPIMAAQGGGDTGADKRVHILKVTDGGAAFVDPEFATAHLQDQRARVEKLRQEAVGQFQLGESEKESEDGGGDGPGADQ